jgi:hypothetical protein
MALQQQDMQKNSLAARVKAAQEGASAAAKPTPTRGARQTAKT